MTVKLFRKHKKAFIIFAALISIIACYRILFKNQANLQTAYFYHVNDGSYNMRSYYSGKLCYDPVKKKAWIEGGLRLNYYKNKKISERLKDGIKENVAEQKELFNLYLTETNKYTRKHYPFIVPYEISPEDREIKIVKPEDAEFFNSLRYYMIKHWDLTEIDKDFAEKYFKTWFHTFLYDLFISLPDFKVKSYYSVVYPHHEISEIEHRVTIDYYE